MDKRLFSSKGIVLSRKYHSEADAIVELFTEDFGKLTLIAHGIKRLKSRKRGTLEPFSLIKFSASKSKGMPIITETEIIESFNNVRKDLKRVAVAYYFLELVRKTNFDEEENKEIYTLLEEAIKQIETSKSLKALRKGFAQSLMTLLGFWPEGKKMDDVDEDVEKIIEKNLYSLRVGRALVV